MEWPPASGWPKGFGIGVAALLAVSLLSFHPFDPTVFSLLTPPGGVQNWLGLPGALVGGSLVEAFGTAALLAPLLVLMWSLSPRGRPALRRYALHGAGALLLVSTLHGLGGATPAPTLWGPGLVGWAAAGWIMAGPGPWLGGALLVAGLGYSTTHLIYGINWAARGREARIVLTHARARAVAAAEAIAAALLGCGVGLARGIESLLAALAGGVHGLGRGMKFKAAGALAALGTGGTRTRPRRRARARRAPGWQAPAEPASLPAAAMGGGSADGLDAWFGELADDAADGPLDAGAGGGPSAEAPQGVPRARRPTDEPMDEASLDAAEDAWDRAARHYAENLDLDWEAKVYRARQVRRPLTDWDAEDDPQEETG